MVLVVAIVPHPGEQAAPPRVSVHVTPLFGVPVTVAINTCLRPTSTLAVEGDTLTMIGRVTQVVAAQPIR
ncbi:MAG TPA: hypothetical protein VNB49_18570 [Candidatus Dormibacteraeota bacterium]|nr:hypothetical protein [Candidatus Dormibacteraeota bacterium]